MPKKLFFMFAWPYLYRQIAKKAAEFLQNRRDRRLHGEPQSRDPECPPCPPAEETASSKVAPKVGYTVAGMALGGAISTAVFLFIRREQPFT